MDPDQAYLDYLDSMQVEEFDDALVFIIDLIDWYNRGGFPAKFPGSDIEVPIEYLRSIKFLLELY